MLHRLLPWLLAFAAAAALAETDLERAERLLDEAKALRSEAEDTYRAAEPACYERFLVNRCIAQAKEARLEQIRRARTMENEANRIKLADKQRQASEAGRTAGSGPTSPSEPADSVEIVPDAEAEALRREREADALRQESDAAATQAEKDRAKAGERAKAEAAAARRAEQAARDRARYDERIRKREAEKAAD
jgi:hypothetical protein